MKGKHVVIMFALVVPLAGLLVWVNRPPEVAPVEFHPQASDLHTLWGGNQATSLRAEPPNPPQLAHWIPVAHELTIYLNALPEYGRLCFVTETARYINGSGATLFHDCFRKEDLEQLGRETRTLRAALALDTAKK